MILELLVASLVALLIGAALLMQMQASYSARNVIQGENSASAGSRHSLDALCDSIRNAQSYQIQATPALYSSLQAGSETGVTCYTDTLGGTTRYWLDTDANPPALKKTTGNTTTVLVSGLSALSFTYYTSPVYTAAAVSWNATVLPHSPSAVELPLVGAIGITTTTSIDGNSRQISSFVRLRNSPR